MKLSIIICTYNRVELLKENLQVLLPKIETHEGVELIVVDNNSTDSTRQVSALLIAENVRYCFEPEQGLSQARNCGLREAAGDWVAYLDDDAYVAEDWLERALRCIESDRFDAFGGVYLPWYRDGKEDWFLDEYASNAAWMHYTEICEMKSGDFFSGGNAFFRQDALVAVNGFCSNLGMAGNTVYYGEEILVQTEMRRQGFRLGYDPDLIIYHYVPLKKQTENWFYERAAASGQSYADSRAITKSIKHILLASLIFTIALAKAVLTASLRLRERSWSIINARIEIKKTWIFHTSKLKSLLIKS